MKQHLEGHNRGKENFSSTGIPCGLVYKEILKNYCRHKCLHVLAIGYVFSAYGMIISQAFNGAGDTRTPTYINLFVFWVLQIPLAYYPAKYLKMEPLGVYIAIGVAETILAIVSIILFKKVKWRLVKA